jgi:hypothetical protein
MYQVLVASSTVLHYCRGVIFFQSGNSCFQVRDMFIGPLDFEAGISEDFVHGMEFI